MPKNRASFLKRQREVTKKQKREEKLQRKLDKKISVVSGEPAQQDVADSEAENQPL